jgi:purine-nucleoside phosphorylase
VILGSGLGNFTDEMEVAYTLPYNEIINFQFQQFRDIALVLGPLEIKNSSNARPFSFL